MWLKQTHCTNCGGMLDLQVDESHCRIFCPYCGQAYQVDHRKKEIVITQNVHVTERRIDDAEVIRARTEARKHATMWYAVLVLVLLSVVFWGCMVFVPRIKASVAQRDGKLSAGSWTDYYGMSFQGAEQCLTELGFSNIVLIDLADADGVFWKEGAVDDVIINGDAHFGDGDYFYPTDKIIIRYH